MVIVIWWGREKGSKIEKKSIDKQKALIFVRNISGSLPYWKLKYVIFPASTQQLPFPHANQPSVATHKRHPSSSLSRYDGWGLHLFWIRTRIVPMFSCVYSMCSDAWLDFLTPSSSSLTRPGEWGGVEDRGTRPKAQQHFFNKVLWLPQNLDVAIVARKIDAKKTLSEGERENQPTNSCVLHETKLQKEASFLEYRIRAAKKKNSYTK